MIAPMAARSPARFLAPLALVAFVCALFLVVQASSDQTGSGGQTKSGEQQPTAPSSGSDEPASGDTKGPRFYRVKAGDTPSAIAERTGVSLSQILELNPDLDPQSLSPGQRIKLRR
jgi:LysM repeat protein